ncbi:MAG: ferritin family protein [Candidatus Zixiibacteriota bacterium]|nr:MAG: ferritin family protein [candidate division Zixibacteria bacterium]
MKEDKKKTYGEAGGQVGSEMTALEALGVAIYNEQSAFDFYTGLADVIKNQSGKKKFEFLASDEKRHRELLEAHYEKTTGGKEFPFDSAMVKTIKVEVRDNTTAAEALDIGIKAEKEAYEFYSKSAEQTQDADAKKMFLMLAEQEDRHYNLLTAEKQALTGQFYWFDVGTPGMMEH